MQGSPEKSLKLSFCSTPFSNYPHWLNCCFISISKTYSGILVFTVFFPYCYSFAEDLGLFIDMNIIQLKQFVNVVILQWALICLCCPTSCHFNSKFIFLKGFSTGEWTCMRVGLEKCIFIQKWKQLEYVETKHFISWVLTGAVALEVHVVHLQRLFCLVPGLG